MISVKINGLKTFAPNSRNTLIEYAFKHKSILIAVNAEKIWKANDTMRTIINRNIGYPDGTGAVWAIKRKGHEKVYKMAGCELWLDIIKKYYKQKKFYLVGGTDATINQTINQLNTEFPRINIVNYRNGYILNELQRESLIQDIVKTKPDIVFVAMGSPKQEILMEEMQKVHAALYQGLGGSFDVYIGKVKRAPHWWVKNNLEWAYRLFLQPKRIKRQIYYIPFMISLIFNKL